MPRTEREIERNRVLRTITVEVTETYNQRLVLADGREILHDGRDLWCVNGMSYYGGPPEGWDPTKARQANSVHKYWNEVECC